MDVARRPRWQKIADPDNQVLEKDLNAIWNQMTPPERQLATKKQ